MTEEEWLVTEYPTRLFQFLTENSLLSDRKARLFTVACANRSAKILEPVFLTAIIIGESFADGLATKLELECSWNAAYKQWESVDGDNRDANFDAMYTCNPNSLVGARCIMSAPNPVCYEDQCRLLREIVNPFWDRGKVPCPACDGRGTHSVKNYNPDGVIVVVNVYCKRCLGQKTIGGWSSDFLTHDVVSMATEAYASKDFSSLPQLGDALEEAGCTDEVLLAHCRGPNRHIRGCWVVDLLLGKE
jgi:hypothetical protein